MKRECGDCHEVVSADATFCTSCGSKVARPPASSMTEHELLVAGEERARKANRSALRTTTLVLGLIAATFLIMGGCTGYVFGSVVVAGEEAFGEPEASPRSEEVQEAGLWAMLVAIYLFLAAGIAKVATRTSLILLALAIPMLLGVLSVDAISLFAITYYLAFVLTSVGVILMFIWWVKDRRGTAASGG